jgi:hypothetical protein
MVVKTLLFGDFADAWTKGDNSKIVATETQKKYTHNPHLPLRTNFFLSPCTVVLGLTEYL